MTGAIRLLIVDDHEIVRAGLRALFDTVARVEVVGEAETARSAVTLTRSLAPDVVLLDLRLGHASGIEVCRRILEAKPATRVVILTAYPDARAAAEALTAGATGFLVKRTSGRSLVRAVKALDRGEAMIDAEVARRLVAVSPRSTAPRLAEAEQQLARLVAAGLTNVQIANRLGASVPTVKSRLARLFAHLEVAHRSEVPARLSELELGDAG